MVKVFFSGNSIYLQLLAMKGFDAIRPEYNCFISMIISIDTLCGFAPLFVTLSQSVNRSNDKYISTSLSVDISL